MEGMDYWRLCDEVTVIQAALLIIGEDPAPSQDYISSWNAGDRPAGYDATFAALTHAILAGRLKARIREWTDQNQWTEIPANYDAKQGEGGILDMKITIPDWRISSIALDDLRTWLRSRGIKTGFFFPEEQASADYLDPANSQYAPKLAAAIGAWEAVTKDPTAMRGKTAKQAIVIWLRRHADRYGLTKDDGSPNEQGIEEVSKIANWDTKGGAPKTPGE